MHIIRNYRGGGYCYESANNIVCNSFCGRIDIFYVATCSYDK